MKKSKQEVEYGRGKLHHHCGPVFRDDRWYCKHFLARTTRMGACEIVEGDIDPEYGCTEFQKAIKA